MEKKSIEYTLKAEKKDFPIEKIREPKDVYSYAMKFYFDDIRIYESVFLIMLNAAHNTIGYAKISQGGISQTIVDHKIVAKYAIESLASSVILVHNHPSGEVRPSKIDDELTKKIQSCLNVFDIKLSDHVIVTDCTYYSYQEEGRI